MTKPFEFRVTGATASTRAISQEDFLFSAEREIFDVLKRRWPLIPWRVAAVTPSAIPPTIQLKTGDPRFRPDEPLTVNGYRFIPAPRPRDQQGVAAAPATEPVHKARRGCDAPSRREGDEYVCLTPGCGLRWAFDEDKPGCPK